MISRENFRELFSSIRCQHVVPLAFPVTDLRDHHFILEIGRHDLDGRSPFQEYPEGAHVLAERHLVDVMLLHVPEPELVEVPSGEVVQGVDAVLFAPVDDVAGPIDVTLDGCLGAVGGLVVEV